MSDLNFQNPVYAEIIFPSGFANPLTYYIPESFRSHIQVGSVVNIPIRSTTKLGVIYKLTESAPAFETKDIQTIYPYALPDFFIQYLEWTATKYLTPLNVTLQTFLPSNFEKYLEKLETFGNEENTQDLASKLPDPTEEQKNVINSINTSIQEKKTQIHLIYGVTGSGKTRVFLELAQNVLDQGKNVLILVPEISLTPQTHRSFQQFLNAPVDIIHSNLSEKVKRTSWLRILSRTCRVLMGTRSAILTPFTDIGLIIIDEEHDQSYKQHDPAPRYHTRDLAQYLAGQHQCNLILASATPSMESYQQALNNRFIMHKLTKRVFAQALPKITLVDMKEQYQIQGKQALSYVLREKIIEVLSKGKQVILLQNRRGYLTTKVCPECGAVSECQDCKVSLVYHKSTNRLTCHYCDRVYMDHIHCQQCGHDTLEYKGIAIEKVEEELKEWIPQSKVIRMDRDTTTRKGASEKILTAFRNQEYNILLGTQMVAKGHDFPNVELVAVISGDTALNSPDFRTNEKTFQLLTQVAGRAGRHSDTGEVIIQTVAPDEPIFQLASSQEYEPFYQSEIQERELVHYPPFCFFYQIEFLGGNYKEVDSLSTQFAQHLLSLASSINLIVYGPLDASISVVKKKFRKKIILKGAAHNQIRWAINETQEKLEQEIKKNFRVKIRIDPDSCDSF